MQEPAFPFRAVSNFGGDHLRAQHEVCVRKIRCIQIS